MIDKEIIDTINQALAADYFHVDTLEQMRAIKAQPCDICVCEETVSSYIFLNDEWIQMSISLEQLKQESQELPFTKAPKIRNW